VIEFKIYYQHDSDLMSSVVLISDMVLAVLLTYRQSSITTLISATVTIFYSKIMHPKPKLDDKHEYKHEQNRDCS